MNKINQFLLSMYIYTEYVRGICTDTRVCKLCYVVCNYIYNMYENICFHRGWFEKPPD